MDHVKKSIHAEAKDIYPYTGEGVTAAILDSGIAMHPDIRDNVAAFHDFVGRQKRAYDDSGHGTHVAGCLCGNGKSSSGKYTGIAPGCRVVSCKVLDEKGEGCVEDMLDAIAFCIRYKALYGIKIINVSVGLNNLNEPNMIRQLSESLEEACDAGFLVVVAAGNGGPKSGSMSPLGNSPRLISVGCYDAGTVGSEQKNCEEYSGRGPLDKKIRKPDIVAPGTGIVSCCSQYRIKPDGRIRQAYISMNGTSMAVPLVSGAAALLWQKYPHFTNEQIRNGILWTARDLKKPWNYQGWGLLDVKAMLGR